MARPSTTDLLRRAARYLADHGVQSAREDAEVLLRHVLGVDRAGLYARDVTLTGEQARAFGRGLCQRAKGTPLQYITGDQPFMGLELTLAPGVFVPRPETEGLVEAALHVLAPSGPNVIDVGTGTGAVALAIKRARPDAVVVATDVSEPAVTMAGRNAARLGLPIEVLLGDLFAPVRAGLRGRVDLVVSNPPYVAREDYESLPREVKREPYEALVGGTRVHERLAAQGWDWLRPGGWLVVEIGEYQGEEVRALFAGRYLDVQVLPDLAGRQRVVRGRRSP